MKEGENLICYTWIQVWAFWHIPTHDTFWLVLFVYYMGYTCQKLVATLISTELLLDYILSHRWINRSLCHLPSICQFNSGTSSGLFNWSINCLRRLPLFCTSHLANIYMCHFNCAPSPLQNNLPSHSPTLKSSHVLMWPVQQEWQRGTPTIIWSFLILNQKLIINSRPASLRNWPTLSQLHSCCLLYNIRATVKHSSTLLPTTVIEFKWFSNVEQSTYTGTWFGVSGWLFPVPPAPPLPYLFSHEQAGLRSSSTGSTRHEIRLA